MIISLDDAKEIYPQVTQVKLDGLENYIRSYTKNNFQLFKIRSKGTFKFIGSEIHGVANFLGFRVGDTIEISKTIYNDGLYVIKELNTEENTVKVDTDIDFIEVTTTKGFFTKVQYPASVVAGVRELLAYENKTKDNIGLKSETISRWTRSFVNPNDGKSKNGYPEHLLSFIDEFVLIDWG